MVVRFPGASFAHVALAIFMLSCKAFCRDDECQLPPSHTTSDDRQSCLLQKSRSQVLTEDPGRLLQHKSSKKAQGKKAHDGHKHASKAKKQKKSVTTAADLSWTTNIGQENHKCTGSSVEVDFSGTHNGMVLHDGILIKKGKCPHAEKRTATPFFTKDLSCEANVTGCHMWCAPVWQSHYDTTDWSAYDVHCKGWDGSFNASDLQCAKAGRIFSWARAEVPSSKNALEMDLALTQNCTAWCAPLWVTIYDQKNWAKSYRWCFNRKSEWGSCDSSEDVALSSWHQRTFEFSSFMQKHGYSAGSYVLELAVYSEFEASEVVINSLTLFHKKEAPATTLAPPVKEKKAVEPTCGSEKSCGSDHQCCRKGDSEVDAKCCPSNWSCCEDSCCPSYYTCTITEFGHTCKPPKKEEVKKPDLCLMK